MAYFVSLIFFLHCISTDFCLILCALFPKVVDIGPSESSPPPISPKYKRFCDNSHGTFGIVPPPVLLETLIKVCPHIHVV